MYVFLMVLTTFKNTFTYAKCTCTHAATFKNSFAFFKSFLGTGGHRALHVRQGPRTGALERHGQQTSGAGKAVARHRHGNDNMKL